MNRFNIDTDIIKCSRCKHKHNYGDRIWIDKKDGMSQSCCPKCRAGSYINTELKVDKNNEFKKAFDRIDGREI